MSAAARGVISAMYLFVALPFGIIFMLLCLTIFKGVSTTGMVYVWGFFAFIFVYIFFYFVFSFFIGSALIFIRNPNRVLVKVITVLTFILLLHDIPPMKAIVDDLRAGVSIRFPWTTVPLAVHVILLMLLVRTIIGYGSVSHV